MRIESAETLTIKQLVLLGAGHTNLQTLLHWCEHPRADTDVTLIYPHEQVVHPAMLAGLVAGHYQADECSVHLPSLLAGSKVRHLHATATQIDTTKRVVHTTQGETRYDFINIDDATVPDRDAVEARIPGARANALFVQPPEVFLKLLPQFLAYASPRALRLAVVADEKHGQQLQYAHTAGAELAMALQHRLPHCHVSFVCNASPGLQRPLLAALRRLEITVLQDNCTGIEPGRVALQSGATLSCDAALLVTGDTPDEHAPAWLAGSGLALDAQGCVCGNAYQQSTSHSEVFLATDHKNLRAMLTDQALRACPRIKQTLPLISCGSKRAIAQWGSITCNFAWNVTWMGAVAWQIKNVRDRRWIRQYLTSPVLASTAQGNSSVHIESNSTKST